MDTNLENTPYQVTSCLGTCPLVFAVFAAVIAETPVIDPFIQHIIRGISHFVNLHV